MLRDMLPYSILQYIVDEDQLSPEKECKLPAMGELADALRVSRGKVREELIAAQAFGVVEMRPGDGTYVRPFDFYTPVRAMVLYSIARDKKNFDRFYRLRGTLETAFWNEAVSALTAEDHRALYRILERAERKLASSPIEIPHQEHRELHLRMLSRLDNEFVLGLLRAHWDAYEAVGLHRYFELSYYQRMWNWHRQMVDAIAAGRYEQAKEILIEHFTLLDDRLQGKHQAEVAAT
jgi:GntR family transcriptional repressor for pyruvate dehydrogenase complex